MATVKVLVLCMLAFNYGNSLSEEYEQINNPDNELTALKQFVLDSFNHNKESVYIYNHVHVLDAHKREGPERNYFMLLDIGVSCKEDTDCDTKNLVCEVIVKEDLTTENKDVSEDDSVCVKKSPPSMSVVNNGGFVEQSVTDEVQRVAELAVEQLENEGDTRRTIFEIMSVKTQDDSDGKKLFLTLKVAKTLEDAVDMTEFETCEIEVSMKDPLTVENSTSCFPISDGQTDYSMSEEDMNEEAKKAVNEINKLSSSPFQHVLVKVVTADRSVTPGSQGSVTTVQFQVAPSLCLKNGGGERDSPAVRSCPPDSSFESQHAPLQCTLTAWERPWHPTTPTIYSGPVCNSEKKAVSEVDVPSKSVSDLSEEPTTIEPKVQKENVFCAGCPIDIDTESESIRALAQEVLTSMETAFAHRLVRVVKAQKQVVNGIKYIMTLEAVRTACPPEAARVDLNGCPVIDGQEDGGVRTCHIEIVERPWEDVAREVLVNDCSGEPSASRKSDPKLHASPDSTATTEEGQSDLNEVVQAFDEMFADEPVSAQVDLYGDVAEPSDDTAPYPVIAFYHRKRRDNGRRASVGGLQDVREKEREKVWSLAQFALERMDDLDEDFDKRVLEDVEKADRQIVNGVLYHLRLRVSTLKCGEKSGGQSKCDGSSPQKKHHYVCKAQVHVPPKSGEAMRLVQSECSVVKELNRQHRNRRETLSTRAHRGIPGGKFEADVDDPYIKNVTDFAFKHVSGMSEGAYKKKLVRVVKAEKQIVSGVMIHLELLIGDSSCQKDAAEEGDCPLQDDAPQQKCYVSVWDRPWLKERQVHNATCTESTTRRRRDINEVSVDEIENPVSLQRIRRDDDVEQPAVGGLFPAELNDPFILNVTEYAFKHISESKGGEFKKTLVRIVKAEKQVVSGVMAHVQLEIGDSSCARDAADDGDCTLQDDRPTEICYVSVWDQPWLNKRRLTNLTCVEKEVRRKRSVENPEMDLHSQMFSEFKQRYNRNYASDEEHHRRFRIFRANVKKMQMLQETEQGTATYGVTQFSDLSAKEFRKHFTGLNHGTRKMNVSMQQAKIPKVKLPAEFDWRHYNVVTEVKNQGMCGSCWAFSVTGNVEGQYALRHKKLLSLSEQELVDCDTLDEGCNGGLMDQAYHAIENLGGLETERDYPYDGEEEKCHFNKTVARVTLSGSVNISTDEEEMARWLFKNGPISIALNANAMQFYTGGVSHPWKILCNPGGLDHGVLIVGFGVHRTSILHRTLPYWIIKNSWGPSWGEKGYYRVYRGDGTCGVNMMASSSIVN